MTESTTPKFAIPELPMQIQTIRQYLPHRYPFLLVDRVIEVTDNSIVGYKNVSINEEFLQGHFPEYPIMPGVLIVEALAQVSGVLGFIMNNETPKPGSLFLFAGAERVRFKTSSCRRPTCIKIRVGNAEARYLQIQLYS